jgi:hypothetical protein
MQLGHRNSLLFIATRCMVLDAVAFAMFAAVAAILPRDGLIASNAAAIGLVRAHPIAVKIGLACVLFTVRRAVILAMWLRRAEEPAGDSPPSWWRLFPYIGGDFRETIFPMHSNRVPPGPRDDGWRDRAPRLVTSSIAWLAPLVAAIGLLAYGRSVAPLFPATLVVWSAGRIIHAILAFVGISFDWAERCTADTLLVSSSGVVRETPFASVKVWTDDRSLCFVEVSNSALILLEPTDLQSSIR